MELYRALTAKRDKKDKAIKAADDKRKNTQNLTDWQDSGSATKTTSFGSSVMRYSTNEKDKSQVVECNKYL